MCLLREKGLRDVLVRFTRPLLGVCLGQQLLYDGSDEGDAEGLHLVSGRVTALPASRQTPAPHMGWSKLEVKGAHPLLEGVPNGAYVYFVHTYACPLSDATLASATYGQSFSAVIGKGNVFGCQFHPERSAAVGARILANFLGLPC
jgi:glutamine amidotransferase